MSLATRQPIYQSIERLRTRPLVTYVTSTRPNAQGTMATDAIPEILDQLLAVPEGQRKVDLLVVSHGGDPTVAWRIMSLLRDRFDEVGVLVPQAAFSAATLLALGADEIVMHPCGNLGPVDPQITVKRKQDGKQAADLVSFGSEDLAGFLNFVRTNVGLSDQEHLRSAFEMFCKEVGPIPIGVASRGARLSVSLGVKLLQMHMRDEASKQKATAIAETLNKEFFHHGYPVGRKEAKDIGLKVVDPPKELESMMWEAWRDLENQLECRHPFSPMREVERSPEAAKLFAPIAHLQMPANLPPELARQAATAAAQQIGLVQIAPVAYHTIAAVVESIRMASAFVTRGRILARRDFEAKIGLNTVVTSSEWERISPTEKEELN